MDPWNQSNSSRPSTQISTEVHQNALACTSKLEAIIASLAEEVCSLKASSTPPPTKATNKSTATQHTTPKQSTSQHGKSPEKTQPSQPKTVTGKLNSSPGLSSTAATSTPKRQIHANSAPPAVGNCKPDDHRRFPS
ncbi:hypothetical protein VP01_9570g2 [Puccinia sorghi]|uniref:Uncharacterized protein n=1 Tax=Puccinia sorghi TaxID=27349 RepID=A0A0L6U6S5_9BASI|nr:hypothetical protein VP01_9570g2 [Puccinia sorghi]